MKTCSNCKREVEILSKTFCYRCYERNVKYSSPTGGGDIVERLANPPEKLTEQQHNILTALMLGDGHLSRGKTKGANANLIIGRAIQDIEYLKWQYELFSNVCTKKAFRTRSSFDKRTNKTYEGCTLYTASLPLFTAYHNKWYVKDINNKNIKIVPNDLVLNAEIIAHWIADDGSLSIGKKGDRIYLSFCTNGFTKDETYFLRDLLNDRYNEYYTVSTFKNKEQYVIRCADSASRTLLADIDPVFPTTMSRKIIWKDILNNDLPRYESRSVSSERRAKAMIEYLSSVNQFTFKSLNDCAELFQSSKDNYNPYNNIMKHMKKYINTEYVIKHDRSEGDYKNGCIYTITPAGKQFFQSELTKLQK